MRLGLRATVLTHLLKNSLQRRRSHVAVRTSPSHVAVRQSPFASRLSHVAVRTSQFAAVLPSKGFDRIFRPSILEEVQVRNTVLAVALMVVACGDPETNDERGYTKAPLEKPTVLVQGEPASRMDELGNPLMPAAPIIEAEPDTATAAPGGGATQPPAQQGPTPAGATAADVSEGQKIFAATGNCFTCHGPTAGGTALAPALNDNQWLNIDGSFASLQTIINNGVPTPKQFPAAMPAKGGAPLSEQQVKQVAAYVYSISR
jgi:mono/diheme cytochrome c family protein